MKVVSLKKSSEIYFKGFDPFEYLEREDVKPTLKLGVVIETEEGDVPAGLLLGLKREKELLLLWIFVTADLRRKGCGEKLLYVAAEYALKNGLERILAVFPQEYGRDLVCGVSDRSFFESHGFTETGKNILSIRTDSYGVTKTSFTESEETALYDLFGELTPEEYLEKESLETGSIGKEPAGARLRNWETLTLTLSELKIPSVSGAILERIAAMKKAGVRIRRLGDISLSRLKAGIDMCINNKHTGFIANLSEIPPEYFDMELSSCTEADEKVNGLLLVHREETENTLFVELLFSTGKWSAESLIELIRFSAKSALELYPPETKLVIPYDPVLHKPLIERLLGY